MNNDPTERDQGREPSRQPPLIPEVIERQATDDNRGWDASGPFGPQTFGGGRVRVYGCSPGCLLLSVIVSIILTLLLNANF